jgi:hypothetical protein
VLGGRREEPVEGLVAVILVAHVGEREVALASGEAGGVGLREDVLGDGEEQASRVGGRDECGLANQKISGIGRAVAIAFAREGADVAIAYLDEHDDGRDTAALVEKAGRRAVLIPGDVSRREHCQEVVDRAVRDLGGSMSWSTTPPSR